MANSTPLVDFPAIADKVKRKAALLHVEFVKHAVIANAQFEFRATLQPLMRKGFQARAHFIHFLFHGSADGGGQTVKRAGKSGRPDLERSDHGSLGLARGVIAGGNFAARFVELCLHFIGQFKLVFEKVFNPRAQFFDFGAGQSRNRCFNFLNCAHAGKIINRR